MNDYKDYIEEKRYANFINANFGFIPSKVDYHLLIGRKEEKEENEYLIKKRLKQLGQNHLNLTSFDEILDYQLQFLERLSLLKVI